MLRLCLGWDKVAKTSKIGSCKSSRQRKLSIVSSIDQIDLLHTVGVLN